MFFLAAAFTLGVVGRLGIYSLPVWAGSAPPELLLSDKVNI